MQQNNVESVPAVRRAIARGLQFTRHSLAVVRERPGLAFALAVIGFLAGVWFVLKVAPEWLASSDGLKGKDLAEERGRVRTALLAVAAGVLASIGAVYTARTFRLN